MNISNLKRASHYDVRKWLENKLELTTRQKEKLYCDGDELLRFSKYHFYERTEKQTNLLWRITILIYPIYLSIIFFFTVGVF